jgi:hypothetical protein
MAAGVDISRRKITVAGMKPLQTRVDDQTARRFAKVARERGETSYSCRQKVVKAAASAAGPETGDQHWEKLKALNLKPAAKTLAELREECGER